MRTKLTPKDIIDNSEHLIIKIGTNSIIDDTHWVPKRLWLREMLKSCVSLKRDFGIVSSGAIGMARVARNGVAPNGLDERQAYAAEGQPALFEMYRFELARLGLKAAQVLLTKHDLTVEPYLSNTRNTFSALARFGTISVSNENDTVAIDEIKIGDNDTLSAYIATIVALREARRKKEDAAGKKTLVLVTDVNGLYMEDPRDNPDAEHIQIVDHLSPETMALAGGSKGKVGTGGMITKLIATKIAAAEGINTIILNGEDPKCLTHLFNGDYKCATFIPYTAHPKFHHHVQSLTYQTK